jgi:hypothetical protein
MSLPNPMDITGPTSPSPYQQPDQNIVAEGSQGSEIGATVQNTVMRNPLDL